MSIRDLFHADLEVDHPSDGYFDAACKTTKDSEENMDNSGNSDDGDSDETNSGDIDDRPSDEDEGIYEVWEGSESDKEIFEQEVSVHSFLS